MNRPSEQALISLLPTINVLIPVELVELSTSLLAQSRSQASNLKAEEEVARSYACTHIACERLKQRLNLPKIQPHPPCPPKVYDRLYRHLQNVLSASQRVPAPKALPSQPATPAKKIPGQARPKVQSNGKPRSTKNAVRNVPNNPEIPSWTMSTIRHLCTTLATPAAPPHILAGVTSILTLPPPFLANNPSVPTTPKNDKIPALIVAVYFFVATRLRGQQIQGKEYLRQRRAAMAALDAQGAVEGRERFEAPDVDAWLREISDRGWMRLDWFANVVEGSGVSIPLADEDDADEMDHGGDEGRNKNEGAGPKANVSALQWGLGTMMQDKVDYLSEAKRLDYLEWKEDVMSRVEQLEQLEREQVG